VISTPYGDRKKLLSYRDLMLLALLLYPYAEYLHKVSATIN